MCSYINKDDQVAIGTSSESLGMLRIFPFYCDLPVVTDDGTQFKHVKVSVKISVLWAALF